MTKHHKQDITLPILKENLKALDKIDLTKLILDSLTKEDLIDGILVAWEKYNIGTNNRIEAFFHRKWKSEEKRKDLENESY